MGQVLELPVIMRKKGVCEEGAGELYPLPLRLFKAGQALPCTIYLKSLARGGAREGVLPEWPCGQLFFPPNGGADEAAWGYFDLTEAGSLLRYLSASLEETVAGDGVCAAEKARFLYDLTLIWTQHFFHGGSDCRTPEQLRLAGALIAHMLQLHEGEGQLRETVLAVRRHDSGLFTHSVTVCMLGLAFLRYLGWPEGEAKIFGLGALLHDIGMTSLPRDTWNKTGPLTAEEQEEIKTHPQRGVHLLDPFADLPGEIFLMVSQHHEGDDGSGYPLGLPEQAIHPWARLLKLLDTYEAMTSIRPWRAPLSSPKALKVLKHGAGKCSTAPALLTNFEAFLKAPGNDK